ncbi:MAG: MFS transporter [Anaeromyxobacter sp.]
MGTAARLRQVYILYYGTVGSLLPYFADYLRGRGFTGAQIGTIQMIPSLLQPAVALGWAALADRRGDPRRALVWATSWAALISLALPFARTPLQVALVVLGMALADRAVTPLLDAITLEHSLQNPRDPYARIRLFGSVSFVVMALAMGRLLTLRGNRPADLLVPAAVTLFWILHTLSVRRLPPIPAAHTDRPGPRDTLALLRDRRLLVLLLACAVHWAACAPYHLFFGVFVRDHGLPHDVTALGMGAGVVAEIAAMLLFPRLERRFQVRTLYTVVFLASALRWAVLSQVSHPAAIVALQLMHGLTFGLFWATTMKALGELVPGRLRATGQGLFSAVVFGGGNAAGYVLSGLGYDRFHSAAPVYAWAAVVELAVGLLAVAAARGHAPGTQGGGISETAR